MPIKHCAFANCNSDTRYPEENVFFLPFMKPGVDKARCDKWILASRRSDLIPETITKYTYVCSKHFVNGKGPSVENPDPLPASDKEIPRRRGGLDRKIAIAKFLKEIDKIMAGKYDDSDTINVDSNENSDLLVEMKRQSTPRKRKRKRKINKPVVVTNKVYKLPIRQKTVREIARLSVRTQTEVFMDWKKFLTVGHLDKQSMISILGLPHLTKIIKFLKMLQLNETYMKIPDQLVLVIWKYRFNLNFESYSYMFSYNEKMMSDLSTLYDCFHKGTENFYKFIQEYEENTIQELGRLISRRIYLDVFEIPVSSHLTFDEMNYSSQYGTTTFKAIVLFVGNLQILYVSDLYAGSTKISHIIKSSQIGNVIRPDDYIIYSKKITKSEVSLINANIVDSIPEDKKVVFSTVEMKIRKKYKILNDILPISYWPVANQIFHNCVSLFNMNLRASFFEFSKSNYNNVIFGLS